MQIFDYIEILLKRNCGFETNTISDIKFYVLYAVFAKTFRKIVIDATDIAIMQIDSVTDDFIISTADEVLQIYNRLGGNDRVAKGSELIAELKACLQAEFAGT